MLLLQSKSKSVQHLEDASFKIWFWSLDNLDEEKV